MQGKKIVICSTFDLKDIESEIFNTLEDGCCIHVILENHQCHGPCDTYDIFTGNTHPTIKCLLVHNNMMPEMKTLDAVLRSNNIEGFSFVCPNCYIGRTP